MKNLRTTSLVTAALLALLLAVPGAAFASQPSYTSTSTNITLGLAGAFGDVGFQHYTVSGGQLQLLLINGAPVTVTNPRLQYSVDAIVRGVSVRGEAQLSLSGRTTSGSVKVTGYFELNSQIAAVAFPLGTCDPVSLSGCTSAVPAAFLGGGILSVTQNQKTTNEQAVMIFESPYLNPFGGPITIASSDGLVALAATYTNAISNWSQVLVDGQILNATTGSPVGFFTQTSSLTENLLSATENDQGTNQLVFNAFSVSYANLDGQYNGTFRGTSTIPTTGEIDCSGAPFLPGTCTETGSISTGTFSHARSDQRITVSGSYNLLWTVPAVGFQGTVQATFKSR